MPFGNFLLGNSSFRFRKGQWEEQSVTAQALSIVTDVLRCVFMLETWRPSILQSVSFATKLSRLYCLFLAGNQIIWKPLKREFKTTFTLSKCDIKENSRKHLETLWYKVEIFLYSSWFVILIKFSIGPRRYFSNGGCLAVSILHAFNKLLKFLQAVICS